MIYKRNEFKINKNLYKKRLFLFVLVIYISGLCAGCSFALENADNFDFVQKVTVTFNMQSAHIWADYAAMVHKYIRDVLFVLSGWLFLNSGAMKCLIPCIPFVFAVQNSCIYFNALYNDKTHIFELLSNTVLKDTAVILIVLIFVSMLLLDILTDKNYFTKFKNIVIYIVSITLLYIIDYIIKIIV